jgi:hypothetical protein
MALPPHAEVDDGELDTEAVIVGLTVTVIAVLDDSQFEAESWDT